MTDYTDLTLDQVLDKIGELGRFTNVGISRTDDGWQINCKVGNTSAYVVRISHDEKMSDALYDGLRPPCGTSWDEFCEPDPRDVKPGTAKKKPKPVEPSQLTMDDLI